MLESFKMNAYELNRSIRVTINLPKDYYHNNRYYPTIYFLDGQNLYHDEEAYRKSFHLENVIQSLVNQEKEAIYIGIWAASNEARREQEYQKEHLAEYIMNTIHRFLAERYRLNSFVYIVGCGKAAYTALMANQSSITKGVVLLAPELNEEQLSQINCEKNKLFYCYAGKKELDGYCVQCISKIKDINPHTTCSFDDNEIHNEEAWQQELLKALNYLVL